MEEIAGEKGTVLLYQNFNELYDSLGKLLKASCGRFVS